MSKNQPMKLSVKLILGVTIFSLLGVLASFLVVNTVVRNTVYDIVTEGKYQENVVHAQEIDAWFNVSAQIVETLSHAIHNIPRSNLVDMLEYVKWQYGHVESIWVATADGGFYDSTRWFPTDPAFVSQERPWWLVAEAARGDLAITLPFVNAATGDVGSTMAMHIPNLNGVEAVIALNMELTQLYNMISSFEATSEGYLHLLGPDGQAIIHPDPRLATVGGIAQSMTLVSDYADIINRLRAGESIVTSQDHNGVSSYYMYLPLASTGWSLVSVVPTTVTNEPVWQVLGAVLATVILALVALAVFAMVYMSIQIRGTIGRSVKAFNARSVALASGDGTAINNTRQDNSFGLDEIDREFNTNLDIVSSLINDISEMHEAHIEGSFKHQADASKYEGAYQKIVVGVNEMVEHHTTAKTEILGCVAKIVRGEFDATIREFPGDEKYINISIEALRENIMEVANAVEKVSERMKMGDMEFALDTSRFEGAWVELVQSLNDILKAVDAPIMEIRNSIAVLNQGSFNPPLVTGDYAGDFLAIKNDFNQYVKEMPMYMKEITNCLEAISNGDLTRSITVIMNGDYDGVKNSVNSITETLHKTMSEISTASEQVLSGASQISSSATDLANGAQEQTNSVEELNSAIELINQQTTKNAESAATANELSSKSTENAQEGNAAMSQMVEAMAQIKESSNGISQIVKTIQDIAFQTNLLALNASVEAARAGEHGKGFAVVADEVRTLAGRSQEAATQTTSLIQNSIDRVDSGSEIAATTAQSLDTIVSSADEVLEIIGQISVASKEQADAIAHINQGLNQISSVTQSNSAVSQETAAASEELNSQAEVLRHLVSFFKL